MRQLFVFIQHFSCFNDAVNLVANVHKDAVFADGNNFSLNLVAYLHFCIFSGTVSIQECGKCFFRSCIFIIVRHYMAPYKKWEIVPAIPYGRYFCNLTTEGLSRKEIMQLGFLICAVDFFGIYTQNSIPLKGVNA